MQTVGMKNYWPFYTNVNDVIGGANLYGGINNGLGYNQLNLPLQAISLNTGYYKLPSGVYFTGSDFSIMAWVNMKSYNMWSLLVNIGNGAGADNVYACLSYQTLGYPVGAVFLGANEYQDYQYTVLPLNQWQHVAWVLKSHVYSIYINGILQGTPSTSIPYPNNVVRTSNFLGRGTWTGDVDLHADVDELKIFNVGLTETQIQFEMTNQMYN